MGFVIHAYIYVTDYKSGALPTELLQQNLGDDAGSRTPAYGFGDRSATVTLHRHCLVLPQGFEPYRSSPSGQSPRFIRARRTPVLRSKLYWGD